jgi:hypothetical protein
MIQDDSFLKSRRVEEHNWGNYAEAGIESGALALYRNRKSGFRLISSERHHFPPPPVNQYICCTIVQDFLNHYNLAASSRPPSVAKTC